jgi:Fe-S-cluster containining protein
LLDNCTPYIWRFLLSQRQFCFLAKASNLAVVFPVNFWLGYFMEDFDLIQCQEIVRANVDRICRGAEPAVSLSAELQRISAEAERFLRDDPADRSQIDCGPGCGSCCVVNVSTLIPEGIAIVRYLNQLAEEQRQSLAEKLERLWCEIRGLDDEERMLMQRCCAFLDDDGCCLIYPVRPLLCRSITSTDAWKCRDALSHKAFGEDRPVLMHQLQQELYECLFTGFAAGLEAGGIDGRSFQLSGLIRLLLNHPARESELLAGHRLSWEELY